MKLFETIKQKSRQSTLERVEKQARDLITVVDSDDKLYIGFEGISLFPIDSSWTVQQIVEKLNELRKTFIQGRMKQYE